MKISKKILLYFSSTVIAITLLSFIGIYLLFSEYREEQFQQEQFKKIEFTVRLLNEHQKMSEELSHLLDEQDIHDFYDEKLLIYNQQKELIFSSIDNLEIRSASSIVNDLSANKRWIETKSGDYDIVGVYIEHEGKAYYAISKAYDAQGYSKRDFLGKVLIGLFLVFTLVVLWITRHLSNIISRPIVALSEELGQIKAGDAASIHLETSTLELIRLNHQVNELLDRTHQSFVFQKNTIQHISHELKTPISVLVSELEVLQNKSEDTEVKSKLKEQADRAKSLGELIDVLLELSKIESGQEVAMQVVRADEMLFDLMNEIEQIYPNFIFELNYKNEASDDTQLSVRANPLLLKQAFLNVLLNGVAYSGDQTAKIEVQPLQNHTLKISFSNSGKSLSEEEVQNLFNYFFRGENSKNKAGFGLGLALTRRIIDLHQGQISYSSPDRTTNRFIIQLPTL